MTAALVALAVALTTPMEELRFAGTVEQAYDDSCAAAAVASLVGPFWGVDAAAALEGDDAAFRGYITVREITETLSALGFAAGAFRVSPEELAQNVSTYGPVIVHFARPQRHYAVCAGWFGGTERDAFVISDPARGIVVWDERQLARHFSGVAVISKHRELRLTNESVFAVLAPARARYQHLLRNTRRFDAAAPVR